MLSKVTECKYKVIRIGQSIYIVWTKDMPLVIRLKEIKYYPLVVVLTRASILIWLLL